MLNYELIGRRIRQARENEKLSQMDMAGLIGVSITHISLVENGKKKVSLFRRFYFQDAGEILPVRAIPFYFVSVKVWKHKGCLLPYYG